MQSSLKRQVLALMPDITHPVLAALREETIPNELNSGAFITRGRSTAYSAQWITPDYGVGIPNCPVSKRAIWIFCMALVTEKLLQSLRSQRLPFRGLWFAGVIIQRPGLLAIRDDPE